MNQINLKKCLPLLFALSALVACDNDFNEIGSNIVGNDNFELGDKDTYDVLAYTQALGPVETTNLRVDASNGTTQLGIYDNPVFGKTTAHVVAELKMQTVNLVNFDLKPKIESATLTIPYFSTRSTTTNSDGDYTYELDSIYGPEDGKLDLGIYESLSYIRTDHETGLALPYYNNDFSQFVKGPDKWNTATAATQNTEFVFSNASDTDLLDNDGDGQFTDEVTVGPRMKIELDKTLMGNKLFGPQAVGKLLNNNIFTEYFRGLHFSVAASGAAPTRLAMLNFPGGKITVKYRQFNETPAAGSPLPDYTDANSTLKTLVLTFTGNTVNLMEYQNSATYANGLASAGNISAGDEKLYLKGGAGSMAVIELFGGAGKFEQWRAQVKDHWLINDASLTFFIANEMDQEMGGTKAAEPNRIFLYDLDNKKVLADYSSDLSTSFASAKYNKRLHGGIIEKNSDGRGTQYKIRITNHLRSLINNQNAKNVRLGLVVTENINSTSNKKVQTPIELPNNTTFASYKKIDEVPTMAVANPLGTILYGSNIPAGSADYQKRLKLTIFYTKPN